MSQVVTGEAVEVDLRIARFGSRLIAGLLDLTVEAALLAGLIVAVLEAFDPDSNTMTWLSLVIAVGVLLGYPVVSETLWRGRTLGKAAMGLRVTRDDGGPPRFRHALVRGLVGVVIEKPGPLLAIPAVIPMMISPRAKRLGDFLAGTIVLQDRVPKARAFVPTMPAPLATWAPMLDLSRLDDSLALALRAYLSRRGELTPAAQAHLGDQLATAVAAVVAPLPPPGTPSWAYLTAVLTERTTRARARLAPAPVPVPTPVPAPVPAPAQWPPARPVSASGPSSPWAPTRAAATTPEPSPAPPVPSGGPGGPGGEEPPSPFAAPN